MTKSELIRRLSKRIKLPQRDVKHVVDTILESMKEALERGEKIEIRGFGTLSVKEYDPYIGRNPKTGEKVLVSKRKLPVFKMGKLLFSYINSKD